MCNYLEPLKLLHFVITMGPTRSAAVNNTGMRGIARLGSQQMICHRRTSVTYTNANGDNTSRELVWRGAPPPVPTALALIAIYPAWLEAASQSRRRVQQDLSRQMPIIPASHRCSRRFLIVAQRRPLSFLRIQALLALHCNLLSVHTARAADS